MMQDWHQLQKLQSIQIKTKDNSKVLKKQSTIQIKVSEKDISSPTTIDKMVAEDAIEDNS